MAEPTVGTTWSLAGIAGPLKPIELVDHRQPPSLAPVETLLPDSFFSPTIIDALAQRLPSESRVREAREPLEVTEAYTTLRRMDNMPTLPRTRVYTSPSEPYERLQNLPGAPTAGGLAGAAVGVAIADALMNSPGTVFVFETHITVRLNGRDYAGIGIAQSRYTHESNARDSVDRAIKRVLERIRLEA